MSENILVVNKRHLGDVILSTAALKLLRRTRPESHITVLASELYLPLLRNSEVVDEAICDPESSCKLMRSVSKTWNILRHRRSKYDVCFFLGESAGNARRFRLLSGIPNRVCASEDLSGKPYGPAAQCTHVISAGTVWDTHVAEVFQNVVRGYYGIAGTESTWASLCEEEPEVQAELLRGHGPVVALCLECSPTNLSLWPDASWIELLRGLHDRGCRLFTLLSPSRPHVVRNLIAASGVPVLSRVTSLPHCASLLRMADLLISVDTGQVHLAAALGVPVLSLSGSTTAGTYPYTLRGTALAASRGCFDCPFIADCPSNRKTGRSHAQGYVPPCMANLPATAVLDWADRLLEYPECPEPYVLVGAVASVRRRHRLGASVSYNRICRLL